MVSKERHPLLEVALVEVTWPAPLGAVPVPAWLDALTHLDAQTPFPAPSKGDVDAVRAMLRAGGFAPSGRNKPCSEYIRAAAADDRFPHINAAVDLTNVAALHGAIPVSTVDAERVHGPLSIAVATAGTRYVFNASGQQIDLGGLLCLHDADGPAANAVKDAQRAKTDPHTTRTLTVFWGTSALPGRAGAVAAWFAERAAALGGVARPIATTDS